MDSLVSQLLALTGRLVLPVGVPEASLLEMRRWLVACLIQEQPGLLPLEIDASVDPAVAAAAAEGERLAGELSAAGRRVRFERHTYAGIASVERAVVSFGPYQDDALDFVRFDIFDVVPFKRIRARRSVFSRGLDLVMLVPAGAVVAGRDRSTWRLPAGTVWIRADRLHPNAQGFVGLRIASGTFSSGAPLDASLVGDLVVRSGATWTLAVVPEPAPGPANGSDGDVVEVTLPTELVVRSAGPPAVHGPLAMSGFGTDVRLNDPAGALIGEGAIVMAYKTDGATWSIDAHRSKQFSLIGGAAEEISLAGWSLPIVDPLPLDRVGEAAHGGSFALLTTVPLVVTVPGVSGRGSSSWSELVANAGGVEVRSYDVQPYSLTADIRLWGTASTEVAFGAPGSDMHLVSRRGGADVATILGGGTTQIRWDRPRAARGEPFGFDGLVESFVALTEADGIRRVHCVASRTESVENSEAVEGLALENLFLHLRPAGRLAVSGSGPETTLLTSGRARLTFDVRFAQPMLPDPYAASWSVDPREERPRPQPAGLHVDMVWSDGGTPVVDTRLTTLPLLPDATFARAWEPDDVTRSFLAGMNSDLDMLTTVDVSGRQHRFGLALVSMRDPGVPLIEQNTLRWPLDRVQLLMEPQVHWEPVSVIASPNVKVDEEVVRSRTHGGPTLVGTTEQNRPVSAVIDAVAAAIVEAASGRAASGAMFGLPFGLHAYARLDDEARWPLDEREIVASLHEPFFVDPSGIPMSGVQQLRLEATGAGAAGADDPSRTMPGKLVQTANLDPSDNGFYSVLDGTNGNHEFADAIGKSFRERVPLHHADLSGYGLSTFSRWMRTLPPVGRGKEGTGVTQVRFDVLIGRTSYEVVQLQSRMWYAQCRVVRTIILERQNSGVVNRYDSGWDPIEDGDCQRYARIETGVVKEFRNIRNIRIVAGPAIELSQGWKWQQVLFDADMLAVPDPVGAPNGQRIPIHDHTGYVQTAPVDMVTADGASDGSSVPTAVQFEELMDAVGPFGGPVDAAVVVGGTLAMQLSRVEVATSPGGPDARFAVSVSGTPRLPDSADWTTVRIDNATKAVAPVEPARGLPVVRRPTETRFSLREAADTCRSHPAASYGFLMSTPAARFLFPDPVVEPGADRIDTSPPRLADPPSLVHSAEMFPAAPFVFQSLEPASFSVADMRWHMSGELPFKAPVSDLVAGGAWKIDRAFANPEPMIKLDLDDGGAPSAVEFKDANDLNLWIEPFDDPLLTVVSAFKANGLAANLDAPTVVLGPSFAALQEIVDVLAKFVGLPELHVEVTAGNGPVPSHVVRFNLRLRIPNELHTRIDIGVGKFHGGMQLMGELHADVTGATRGRLDIELAGDVQQGIIPPLLYAGGYFRFALGITDGGTPRVEMGLATTASIGGDLVKNLIEIEATVRYGYTLVPETLEPGVLLGLEVRAKLLAGLLGLSFGTDVMARIARLDPEKKTVTIWAEIRVAATVQLAWCFKEERQIRTQFEQELPLTALAVAAGLPFSYAVAVEQL